MELTHSARGYRLQPRSNDQPSVSALAPSKLSSSATNLMTRIFIRSDEKCKDSQNSNTCEKPTSLNSGVVAVLVVVPIVLLAALLFYLHRRNVQKQRLEDIQDPHKSLDFGLDDPATRKNRRSMFMGGGEKGNHHKASQLSMDMNLSSPYLLPPGLQQSRESLHSLARSLGNDQDPYQQVNHYTNSETGSMRSFRPGKESASIYTKSSAKHMSGRSLKMPPRTDSGPRSPLTPTDGGFHNPFNTPAMPSPSYKPASPPSSEKDTFQPKAIVPEIVGASDFDKKHDIQPPPPALAKSPQFELPPSTEADKNNSATSIDDGFPLPPHRGRESNGLGLNFHLPKPPVSPGLSTPALSTPNSATPLTHDQPKDDIQFIVQPDRMSSTSDYIDDYAALTSDRNDRVSYMEDVPPQFEQAKPQGLGIPHQDTKRLSVGFRPLPPDEVTESEDPEYRANRIRSFYKEYFDDSKEAPPPMPPMPAPRAQYQGEFDRGYLGEAAAYFDPETNAFVMPYAEPVTRRAMTPPPSGRRGPGGPAPRRPGGPHAPHGSLGGMSLPGGPRGRPRAGSAFGRAPSAFSSRAGSALGPRPDSSASARGRQHPKKNLPPPAPLTTLPTPSKLKDDSFAILNPIDFAPPDSIRDTAAGRSQSPFGERRPYSPTVPAAVPVVSAFDELAALPSPHLLRKSGTFTALDFAPPKKFGAADTMSDAGSIRSNRSGLSPGGLGAIRNGAGRVSRLPGDTVFTQNSLQDQLKPQWGMRA
ncbi:hypothetical protein BGZ63DRAFT_57687 [Mariannaea sp. PMI_226]|nr:hypothetical protein BGZ63DRAFT_57687 [Mariannaea sp. PMI_226]